MDINYLAVVVAAISAFMLGGLWYSPVLFGLRWMKEVGLTEQQLQQGNMKLIFGGALLFNLLSAAVFALFLGPAPSLMLGVGAGFAAGFCWVAASFGVCYLFERRSMALFMINGGYCTVQFTLYGLIFGLWH